VSIERGKEGGKKKSVRREAMHRPRDLFLDPGNFGKGRGRSGNVFMGRGPNHEKEPKEGMRAGNK